MPTQQFFPDGRKVYAKIRASDGQIQSRLAHWPASPDDTPIIGDDGSTLYLPIMDDPEPVEYDSDLFFVKRSEDINETRLLNKKELIKRSKEELKVRVENYEALHRSDFVPPQKLSALAVIGLGIVLKYAKNLTPTPEEEAYVTEIVAASASLQANLAIQENLNQQIDADQEPDIKTPWVKKP